MVKKVAFYTPLLTHSTWTVLLLAAQWSASVLATNVCGSHVNPLPYCYPTDPVRNDLWRVNIDCSVPDTISVLIEDLPSENRPSSTFSYREIIEEVRIHCTDGNVQAEMSVNCSISGGRYHTISNLSASGIQPGWMCSLSGCFRIEDRDGGRSFAHTPTDNCTLNLLLGPTECQVTNNCTQTCTRNTSNGTSSYECGCYEGYKLNPDNITCDDIDECSMTCFESDNRICSNTVGSYACDCKDGYQENEASQVCEDIDECQDFNLCSPLKYEECVNTQGSYSCQCMAGYENSTLGTCVVIDIDECVSNPCDSKATCMNKNGTFTCECDDGYEWNGITCQAIEIQPHIPNREQNIVISGIYGAVVFLLLIIIVVLTVCICYYNIIRKSSSITTKKNDEFIYHDEDTKV